MYIVSDELYNETARKLIDAIGGSSYFSGSVYLTSGDMGFRLALTVIVYRRHVTMPEGEIDIISDIVPLWWEFHSCRVSGEELNDFSFSDLKPYIVTC